MERPGTPSLSPRAGPVRARRALLVTIGVLLFLLPRLWRIESVGEGLDEEASVYATRAMSEGRFPFDAANDVRGDEYQSRFCPVPEAVAVPFLRVIGDRALAFRLPWTLAALATCFLLMRSATRRWGVVAGLVVFTLLAFDPKNVLYSQMHRYVVLEGLLSAAFVLLSLQVVTTHRARDAAAPMFVGVGLLHTHLLGAFVVFGVVVALVAEAWRARPRRLPLHLIPFVALLLYAGVLLVWFRDVVDPRFFASPRTGSELARATTYFVRMLGNIGPVAGPLGLVGAFVLSRATAARDRLLGSATLVAATAYPLAALFVDAAPRYLLCLQPMFLLCAASTGATLAARYRPRPAILAAGLLLAALPSVALTSWYLTTGGGRDEEQHLNAELAALARPGDGVLYVDQYRDPYHRRPSALTPIARIAATGPEPWRLDTVSGAVYLVVWSRYLDAPLFTPEFRARLETIRSIPVSTLFQASSELTLFRLRR